MGAEVGVLVGVGMGVLVGAGVGVSVGVGIGVLVGVRVGELVGVGIGVLVGVGIGVLVGVGVGRGRWFENHELGAVQRSTEFCEKAHCSNAVSACLEYLGHAYLYVHNPSRIATCAIRTHMKVRGVLEMNPKVRWCQPCHRNYCTLAPV